MKNRTTSIGKTHTLWTGTTSAENTMETDNDEKRNVYSEHVFFIRLSVFNHIYIFFFLFCRVESCFMFGLLFFIGK